LSTGEGDPAAIATAPFESSRGVPGFDPDAVPEAPPPTSRKSLSGPAQRPPD